MRVGLTSVLAIGAVGTGCLLTTSLDGLDESPAMVGALDGAALPGDSGVDTGARTPDGAADAGGADASPAAFRCSSLPSIPAFCTDFDMGTIDTIIGTQNTALGGVVRLDDAVFRSPSRSLQVTAPALSGPGNGRANVSRIFGFVPQTSIVVELDLRLDSLDKSSSNTINLTMGGYELALFLGGSAKLREGLPTDGGGLPTFGTTALNPPKLAAWVRVSLAVKIATGASTGTVAYDGVAQPAVPLLIESYRASNWRVDVGLNFVSSPDDGRDVHIDNLVIDAKAN